MILRKFYHPGVLWSRLRHIATDKNITTVQHLHNLFDISESKAELISLKHPVVTRLSKTELTALISAVHELGYPRNAIIDEPVLFSILPITLKYRYKVLEECGLSTITPAHIVSYLHLVKKKTIGELKKCGIIPNTLNLENRLASCMTQWPTSLTTLIYGDVNEFTLHTLRLKIIKRYLELVLDLTNEEFYHGISTYPTIKHRPLKTINETLKLLQSQVLMPSHKIKNNLYLVHADPDNLKQILFNFRSIGGIDVREILRMHPKLATKSYHTLIEIRQIFQDYGIGDEAQRRCFELYTLGPQTIRERLEKAKNIPEFQTFFNHPRFLKMIYYNKTAMKRLSKLYDSNKKCLSLNILSGSSAHYETFEKAPGDRLGKGKDLIYCLTQALGRSYSIHQVRNTIKRHPFWINIPLVQVKYVYEQLSVEFTPSDIYKNCPILLYPWNKIKDTLRIFDRKQKQNQFPFNQDLNFKCLSKSQKLSLVLYLLEKKHYFSGNGIWTEEKIRSGDLSPQVVQAELSV